MCLLPACGYIIINQPTGMGESKTWCFVAAVIQENMSCYPLCVISSLNSGDSAGERAAISPPPPPIGCFLEIYKQMQPQTAWG